MPNQTIITRVPKGEKCGRDHHPEAFGEKADLKKVIKQAREEGLEFFHQIDSEHGPPALYFAQRLGVCDRMIFRLRRMHPAVRVPLIAALLELKRLWEIGEERFPKRGEAWGATPVEISFWFLEPEEEDRATTGRCALCHTKNLSHFEVRPSGDDNDCATWAMETWAYCDKCWGFIRQKNGAGVREDGNGREN